MENAPHHLEPVFLDLLKPLYTNRLASFELLSECLPGVTQNVFWINQLHSLAEGTQAQISWNQESAHRCLQYSNKLQQGATGKFSVLILVSLPLFHNALEVARGKDQQRLKRLKQISQKVIEEQKKWKIEEAVENEKRLRKGGAAYSAGKFWILTDIRIPSSV